MNTATKICVALVTATILLAGIPAMGQGKYPSGPVEIMVAWAAGGATDVLFRAVGSVFPKYANNQQLIVKNVPGGGAAIGYTDALKAKGDGYTLIATATPMITKIHMSKVKFDAMSFTPVIMIADNACMIMVPAESPYKDLKDFVADAQKRPGQVTIGNAGSGGGYHLAALAFQNFAKVKFNHIPFEGGGPAITAVLGKHVDSVMVSAPEGVPQALAGQLRVLGVFGDNRLDKFPKILTAKEQGLNFNISMWRGIMVPKDTPKAIATQVHDIVKKVMEDKDFIKKTEDLSVELRYMNPEQAAKFVLAEDLRYQQIIQAEKLGDRYK
jgi:tripartite-type tricarboxylate transporter receptor subunit TctC